jgi:hypothetical protein
LVLKNIKAKLQYDEFEVHYNTIEGISSLALWFVDPEKNIDASGDEVDDNTFVAMRSAAQGCHQLSGLDCCVDILVDIINPIVVDSNYNGWFSAQVDTSNLSDSDEPTEAELEAIEAAFDIGYIRMMPPNPIEPPPAEACTWQETRTEIQQHFSPIGII